MGFKHMDVSENGVYLKTALFFSGNMIRIQWILRGLIVRPSHIPNSGALARWYPGTCFRIYDGNGESLITRRFAH